MDVFSLNNFIKICLLDTGSRISEIQKRLDGPSGYDFYNSFQRAIRAKATGKSDEHIEAILEAPTKDVERKYNREAFNQVDVKFGKKKSFDAVTSKKSVKFRSVGIEVVVDPLFQFEVSGIPRVVSVWPAQKPELLQKYAAVACYIMRKAYNGTNIANAQLQYYDTIKDKLYSEKQITNNTSLILNADLQSISTLLKEL